MTTDGLPHVEDWCTDEACDGRGCHLLHLAQNVAEPFPGAERDALHAMGQANAAAFVQAELASFQKAVTALASGFGMTRRGAERLAFQAMRALAADIEEQAR